MQSEKGRMEELLSLIQQVANQSKRLKEEVDLKTLEINRLKAELIDTTAQKTECEAKLIQLTGELKHKNIPASTVETTVNVHERVDELVKEIDECIHHLKR